MAAMFAEFGSIGRGRGAAGCRRAPALTAFVGPAGPAVGDNGDVAIDLDRFRIAQAHVYDGILAELRRGQKTGHWIWYIFPQVAGLGRSPISEQYAIRSLEEAQAYAADAVLGARLRECAATLLEATGRTAQEILGETDAMKVRSSMTLFRRAAPDEPVFAAVLDRFYGGLPDTLTDERLG
jgi:uncharacterized protein (DUF1810 family)